MNDYVKKEVTIQRCCCIICCCEFRPKRARQDLSLEQFLEYGGSASSGDEDTEVQSHFYGKEAQLAKFCEEVGLSLRGIRTETFISSLQPNVRESQENQMPSVCFECVTLIDSAMESKDEINVVESNVRSLQLQILQGLKDLKDHLEGFGRKMGRIQETVRDSKKFCNRLYDKNCLETSELKEPGVSIGVAVFRECILNGTGTDLFENAESIFRKHMLIPSTDEIHVKTEVIDDYNNEFFGDGDHDDNKIFSNAPENVIKKVKPLPIIPRNNKRKKTKVKLKFTEGIPESVPRRIIRPRRIKTSNGISNELPVSANKESTQTLKEKKRLGSSKTPPRKQVQRRGLMVETFKLKSFQSCELCPFKTNIVHVVEQHFRKHEVEDKHLHCSHCPSKFSSNQFLRFHELGHAGHFTMACDVCKKNIPFPNLEAHLKVHGNDISIIKCDNCSFFCTTRFAYFKHLKHHISRAKNDAIYTCDICSNQFSTFRNLNFHYNSEHKDFEQPFQCDIKDCKKTFPNFYDCTDHQKHDHLSNGFVACPHCSQRFKSTSSFKSHLARHGVENTIECKVCFAKFRTFKLLNRHQVEAHNDKTHKCAKCEKVFIKPWDLYVHRRRDHGIQLKCEICSKVCLGRSHLTKHMISHSDEKRHTCELCGKSFKLLQGLKVHMALHNGMKPWKCSYCDKAFARKEARTHT